MQYALRGAPLTTVVRRSRRPDCNIAAANVSCVGTSNATPSIVIMIDSRSRCLASRYLNTEALRAEVAQAFRRTAFQYPLRNHSRVRGRQRDATVTRHCI